MILFMFLILLKLSLLKNIIIIFLKDILKLKRLKNLFFEILLTVFMQ